MQDGLETSIIVATLHSLRLPIFLIDGDGRVCARSELTEPFLSSGILRIREGQLEGSANNGRKNAALKELFSAFLCGAKSGYERLRIHASAELEVCALAWPEKQAPPQSLIVLVHERAHDARPQLLRKRYGLTKCELAIALAIAAGESRRDIAEKRCVSLDTVRSQLKSIYQKLGCRREAELVLHIRGLQLEPPAPSQRDVQRRGGANWP